MPAPALRRDKRKSDAYPLSGPSFHPLLTWALPWLVSVPSLSRMIWGC